MLKMRVTLGAALIASSLTVIAGLLGNLGVLTLGYRALISAVIFAIGGFLLGNIIENHLQRLEVADQTKGQKIDITSQDTPVSAAEPVKAADDKKSFNPLTRKDFAQVSAKQ